MVSTGLSTLPSEWNFRAASPYLPEQMLFLMFISTEYIYSWHSLFSAMRYTLNSFYLSPAVLPPWKRWVKIYLLVSVFFRVFLRCSDPDNPRMRLDTLQREKET